LTLTARFTLLTLSLFWLNFSLAQKNDLKTIKEKLELKDEKLIIINGIPYNLTETKEIDSVLNSFSNENLVELTKIKNDGKFAHWNNDVAIVLFTYQQKEKDIKRILKDLENKFPDKYLGYSQHILTDSKSPVLFINDKSIHHTEAKRKIEKLKLKDIHYINYRKDSVSAELYGQNGKNGLVRIWLK
jgi:hypothetical protein